MMDEIQGAYTPVDMWQVEKKMAYGSLNKQHHSMSDCLTGKDGSGDGSSEIVDAEEEFCKSISTLISTVITEGAKIPGEHGVALMSSIFLAGTNFTFGPGTSAKHCFTTGEGVQDHLR